MLSGAFVVINGYSLFGIGLFLQADVPVDCFHKGFQSFGNGVDVLESFTVLIMTEKGKRTDGSVNFRGYDTLREKTAVHTHGIVLPFLCQPVDIERCKQRNVLSGQVVNDVITHSSVSHIDDG